jgi:hypothetical protein
MAQLAQLPLVSVQMTPCTRTCFEAIFFPFFLDLNFFAFAL